MDYPIDCNNLTINFDQDLPAQVIVSKGVVHACKNIGELMGLYIMSPIGCMLERRGLILWMKFVMKTKTILSLNWTRIENLNEKRIKSIETHQNIENWPRRDDIKITAKLSNC